MITRKLNPRIYNSLLVLLDAVHLYKVYRRLDTLSLYLYYELLLTVIKFMNLFHNIFLVNIESVYILYWLNTLI